MRFLFILFVLGFFTEANAYLEYSPNANLQEEVEAHDYRILPHTKYIFWTVDADFFKPAFFGSDKTQYYKYDFYHGNGYWMDLRTEFKPSPDFVVNFKASVTHGTSSNGPTYLATILPRVGVTYRNHDFLGLDWEARLSDINRQTIGTGLFIEDRDTDGGYVIAKAGDFMARVVVDGTGSYKLDGGVVAGEASVWNGLLGVTGFINETETTFHAPQFMGTVFTKHTWDNGMGYGLEYGGDNITGAGLAYLQYDNTIDGHFHFMLKPQARMYGKGILGSVPGHVEQNYISYDQNDKPFTNLMDIFAYGDHVETYSAQVNAEYIFNHFYRVYVESEFIDYQYHDRAELKETFFRAGFKFFPLHNRPEEFGFLVGNKYLIASTTQSQFSQGTRTYSAPDNPDFENKPLFMQQMYFMFNFSTKM